MNIGDNLLPKKVPVVCPDGQNPETPIKTGCLTDSRSEPNKARPNAPFPSGKQSFSKSKLQKHINLGEDAAAAPGPPISPEEEIVECPECKAGVDAKELARHLKAKHNLVSCLNCGVLMVDGVAFTFQGGLGSRK
jgi:hypothetical protein